MPRKPAPDTAQRILDIAERLVQTRGFNGFSYADIAGALSLTKASLHYHFPSKAELGIHLIARYEKGFLEALGEIDRTSAHAREKLARYAKIYADVLRNNRMCLCGMLAAEYATLPKAMKDEMRHFFDENERWLVAVLEDGRRSGALKFSGVVPRRRPCARRIARRRDDARPLVRRGGALRSRRRPVARRAVTPRRSGAIFHRLLVKLPGTRRAAT